MDALPESDIRVSMRLRAGGSAFAQSSSSMDGDVEVVRPTFCIIKTELAVIDWAVQDCRG